MYRVGLTGNIASGKSAVTRLWETFGATIIDADDLARRVVAPGSEGLAHVVEAFGPDVLDGETLDRAALRSIVFEDPGQRRRLEAIVHPEVERLRKRIDARLEKEGVAIVVHAIPLLFEVGLENAFDVIVLVDAPEAVTLERIVESRSLDHAEAQRMLDAQIPSSEKHSRSDIIIRNDGTRAELADRAKKAWREIQRRAAAAA